MPSEAALFSPEGLVGFGFGTFRITGPDCLHNHLDLRELLHGPLSKREPFANLPDFPLPGPDLYTRNSLFSRTLAEPLSDAGDRQRLKGQNNTVARTSESTPGDDCQRHFVIRDRATASMGSLGTCGGVAFSSMSFAVAVLPAPKEGRRGVMPCDSPSNEV